MAQRSQLRNMTFNETFESSLMEKNQEKFTIDRSLVQGIKYLLTNAGKTTSPRSSTVARTVGPTTARNSTTNFGKSRLS